MQEFLESQQSKMKEKFVVANLARKWCAFHGNPAERPSLLPCDCSEIAGAVREALGEAEMLWVVLANVSGGDWTKQSHEWQDAAARARDQYFAALRKTDA